MENMKRVMYMFLLSLSVLSCSSSKECMVRMYTTEGNIDIRLYEETVAHRENFVKLVREHRFDSLLFHRVIKDFMVQGGDPDSKYARRGEMLGGGDLGYSVPAEFMPEKYFHRRGVLAAAREGDDVNPSKASSASQFYIVWGNVYTPEQLENFRVAYGKRVGREIRFTPEQAEAYTTVGGTPHLDGEYTVFGEVVSGLEVVDAIQNKKCDRNDRPIEDVRIIKVEFIK
jgi:peptidyl-prolyl cis-trans isomerase B (cyclophilin B)